MKSKKYKLSAIIFYSVIIALALGLPNMAFATPVPDTGQTKCYDNTQEIPCPQPGQPFFGQDAQYGPNLQSYTDLGSGIVRDNVTGLEWVKDGNLMVTRDPAFDADGKVGDGRVTWQHALDYVAKLNNENYLAHSDWRLPTIKELSTLVDSSIPYPGPTINTTFFPGTLTSTWYWSSTTYANVTTEAWSVYFGSGGVGYYSKLHDYYVRAVRSGQSNTNNFIDNGDGTITDTGTGLMWQQATAPGTYTWEQALTYCENLTLPAGGYSDWRLPNRNELQTIVDYSIIGVYPSNPVIDTTYFPDTVASSYWSSTTSAANTGSAWSVYFGSGGVGYYSKTSPGYVWAVRNDVSLPTTTTIIPTTTTSAPSTTTTAQVTTSTTTIQNNTTTIPDGSTTTTIPSGDFQILNHMMTNQSQLNDCATPVPTDTYENKKNGATCWIEIANLKVGDIMVWRWYDSKNNMVRESTLTADKDIVHGCANSNMFIDTKELGNWHVDFYHNDIKQFTEYFTITAAAPSGPCAAEAIYGGQSEQTKVLRQYRDNALSKTPDGREFIKNYYKLSPTVTKLLEQRPLLKNRVKAFIDGMLPWIRKKVEESEKEQ